MMSVISTYLSGDLVVETACDWQSNSPTRMAHFGDICTLTVSWNPFLRRLPNAWEFLNRSSSGKPLERNAERYCDRHFPRAWRRLLDALNPKAAGLAIAASLSNAPCWAK